MSSLIASEHEVPLRRIGLVGKFFASLVAVVSALSLFGIIFDIESLRSLPVPTWTETDGTLLFLYLLLEMG